MGEWPSFLRCQKRRWHRTGPAGRFVILPAMNGAATAPPRPLRLLHLEDSEPDHALALAHLRRSGLDVLATRVESRLEFVAALQQAWDVVLSDYHLPGFNGVEALQLLRQHMVGGGAAVPFILVSGQIGEDTAVEAMRNGASDYLLKNNLSRLAPAIEHAIAASDSRRARQAAERELQASKRRLSELAQHLQTSVEAERHAIAREIHDDVGGSLTALKFELDWIRRHAGAADGGAPREIHARVQSALDLVTHAIEASQRIMQNLRPAILEQGLVAALQWMSSAFARRTHIACEFRAAGQPAALLDDGSAPLHLPPGVALVAYRTAQEALTNVSKHAQATRVVVDLSTTGGVLSLEISDNGRGLAALALAKAQSFGIRGLQERASTVGGWVDLSSGPAGTSLILSVPLQASDAPSRLQAPASDGSQDSHDSDDSEDETWSTRY